MDNIKRFVAITAVAVLGLAAGSPAGKLVAAERAQLAMMDEMKMKPDSSSGTTNNMGNMGQPGSQSQSTGGGRMDDKMKMPMPGQMQDCQGAGCQPRDSNMMPMMQMMERMHGRMNQQMNGMGSGTGASASGPADVTERLEGRIAFLKTELQITDKQTADWNVLADALRSSRQHLLEARKLLVMDDKVAGPERLDRYEHHLGERLEAIKSARSAFARLYGSLSDGQKQTADAILLPLIATF
jgi:hypothetical protein